MICREHGHVSDSDAVRDLISHYCNHGHGCIDYDEWGAWLCPICRAELIDGIVCSECGDEFDPSETIRHDNGKLYCAGCYRDTRAAEIVTTTIDTLIRGLELLGVEKDRAEELIKDSLY